ncbi:MAG: DEAD/DEAH box helicase [Candidatus Calescibacterium sp.]|nr:DEAD/DEAH box helicase [Candidatus Calescibacterium sp.]MDW8132424.1 DEAD/DEAH box helicase [Candidatus Calescibacterium sp.]
MFYNLVLKENLNKIPTDYDNIIFIIEEKLNPEELETLNKSDIPICNYKNIDYVIREIIKTDTLTLKVNQNISQETLIQILNRMGYKQSNDTIEKNSYQIRGNIIDINCNTPVRVEIEDDKIESIRTFDPHTLLSIKKINSIKIYGNNPNDKNLTTHLKILFLSLEEKEIVENLIQKEIENLKEYIDLDWNVLNIVPRKSLKKIDTKYEIIKLIREHREYRITFSNKETFEEFTSFIIEYCRKKRMSINEFNIANYEILEVDSIFGFVDHENRQIFITMRDLKEEPIIHNTNVVDSIKEFREGDLVVVEGYGIGIYLGIQKLKISHYPEKEFVTIQFKKNRKIHFSVESVNLHKYLSSEKVTEKIKEKILSIPSFKSWQKKLEKVYEDIKTIGQKIIQINAERYSTTAHKLVPNEYDKYIEETFDYILTEDQEKVINEVLADLEKPFPSNRLILADTGYGKTEVIIRAIVRSLSNNYKSILFVPTTILAYQHYMNITKRLKDFRIGINTSLYKTASLNDLYQNNIDLLISTPFDITKYDNGCDNIGLVVIDEEHLMGAIFKETLKGIFKKAHFLYSSATPIPRTYFMAKTGILDISVIKTPPPTYKPPKTFILTFTDKSHKLLLLEKLIRKSLNYSLKIIYVNNNIDELYEKWYYFKNIASSSIIHAKLNSKTIQKIFMDFIKGKFDIILSTTIVQSGVDTPEFDVVIIDNSQMLGISQLYQLRGRVGRGSKNPYCYILIQENFVNTPTFERISIFEKDNLSNIDIAQKDMDIRGPGSILSKKQSGNVEQIGLIQFLKMVNQYLNQEEELPEIECDAPTFLPESPIKNKLYRQLLTTKNLEEFQILKKEIIDIYGKNLPEPTLNLLKLIEYRIKNKGKKQKIRIKIINGEIVEA